MSTDRVKAQSANLGPYPYKYIIDTILRAFGALDHCLNDNTISIIYHTLVILALTNLDASVSQYV